LLQEAFEEQAARSPHALAVVAGDERLTYGELDSRADQLARHLRRLGVGPEIRVGLCVERRAGMVAALLGILKAGGAYVPLDPAYPRQRLAYMLEDSGAEVLVAERRTLEAVPAGDRRVVLLDSPLDSNTTAAPLEVRIDPENLAYLVYTSGSTGRPKGVALTHCGAVALLRWARATFTPEEMAGVLASTSLCFDLSVFEIFAPLSVGGTVIVAADALALPSLPADPPVTLLNTVPSAGAELVRAEGIPPSVRVATFCGEALPASVPEGFYRTTAVRRVFNLYGPSEDTVYSTAACVEPGSLIPPIGRPIPGTRAYVVGPDGELVTVTAEETEGELLLGGLGLARGYLGRPELTAERFVPDPWSGEPGARLYRTGDLVRHRPDGELLFVGRADQQIKLRGFRIELGEIDATLLRHPAVREAVTVARQDGPGGLRLTAFVVLEEPEEPEEIDEPAPGAGELRSFLGRTLPEPMLPAVFARLEALPRTLNGKVDRKALPETPEALPESGAGGSPAVLEILSLLWAEALEVERVEPHADLFALGARAPQVAWVLARVRDLLGVAVPERALSAAPTVAGLARAVESGLAAVADEPIPLEPPLVPVPRQGGLPLSFAQERLWFLERLRPGEPTYNEPAALDLHGDLRGPLPVAALSEVLSELVRRHEAFRCRYGERGGEPFQEACPPVPILVPVADLAALPEPLRALEAERVARLEVGRLFDLGRPPLLRALLIRGDRDHVLVVTIHHIAYDSRTRFAFFQELAALYSGSGIAAEPTLQTLQAADFAAWERRAWRGVPDGRTDALATLLHRLAEAAPLELPSDRPRPADPSSAGATLRFALPPEWVARLRGLAREEGSSLFRLLLAVFAALLGRLAGQEAGTVGTTTATRRLGEGPAGFFVNLLPLPLDLAGRPTLRQLLARSRETVDAAMAVRDLPYQHLAALRQDGEDLFRVLFQMVRMPPFRLAGLEVRWRPVDTGTAKFDFETTLEEHGEILEGLCQFRTDLYDRPTAAAFAARFQALLEEVDPDVPLEDHAALREVERRQSLVSCVDRRARRAGRFPSGSARPATPTEELIAQIEAEVLGVESVGRHDNFFHLGGHSLLAARVLARIQETLGARLPVRALFQAPTVETLAEAVLSARGMEALPPLVAVPGPGPHPVSHAQEALWLVTRMEPEGPLYNVALAYRLRGALDRPALVRSLRAVAERHAVLRSRLLEVEGHVMQEVAVAALGVPWIDLAALPEPEPELDRLLREEAAVRFDLSRGPLARARLVILGEEDHLLQITAHHTAFDGWSQGILERDLSQYYAQYYAEGRDGEGVFLQYADFARWQRERLRGDALERLLGYWRGELAGAPAELELTPDRPRPAVRRARGACVRRALPADLGTRVRSLCRAEGVTPFMVFLAAFQARLHRATGQDDVLVGAPVASRHRPELESLIGLFVDTLVLRGRFGGERRGATFRELLGRTRETALAAYAHQDLPLERLVAELRPERGLSRNPLFQVMLAVQNTPPAGLSLGLTATPVDPGVATAMFDLTLTVEEERTAALEYDADLFDATTAESLLDGFLMLLAGAAADPGRRISEIALVETPQSATRNLPGSRNSGASPASQSSLISLIASHDPAAVALALGDRELTYGELDRRSGALAHRLRGLGVGPEEVVGICLERSPELAVALLAVWKAGGACLPLDPALPAERRAFLLEDSGARAVVDREGVATAIPCVHPDDEDLSSLLGPPPPPETLAYVLYTSGSTGGPKPVGVTHAALARHVLAAADLLELTARDRVLFFASPAFDVALEELLPALVRGATVVLRGAELWPPADFSGIAAGLGLTVADLPTAYWRQWVREPSFGSPSGALRPLRVVTVGGEAMPVEEARLWLRGPLAAVRLLNAYGPTEAVITATSGEVDAASASRPRTVSLGRPLPGRRACVLDLYGQLQTAGVAGELCLGGRPLARGYVDRPDLTAERFVPDPWPAEPGARLYRTGDRARLLPDGTLEYLGRLDRQLKIRGVRIEPGEIEAALLRHPAVREAAVDLRPGPSGEPLLVAWVVESETGADLQAHLRLLLPEALVPAAFVILPALPLTPAGKVDRLALPAPETAVTVADDAPRTPAEELLAAIWTEVLGIESLGVRDSFFALGGHSLLAVRVLSRVREAFGVDLPMRALFAAPTIRGLARAVETALKTGEESLLPPLASGPQDGRAPLSFPQQRLWFLDRLQPGRAVYNVPIALRLDGPLDPAALERSLGEVVRRHEPLRTRFVERDGQPWQEIVSPVSFPWPAMADIDLRALPTDLRAGELARLGREEEARPFDLSRAPLLRATLARLDREAHALFLTLHHIVSDAWSDEILLRELAAAYAGRPLPGLPVRYADYARWQRSWPEVFLASRLAHWRDRLAGLAGLELPADRPRPPVQSFRGGVISFTVPGELTAALRDLTRHRGATLFMVLLAAWQSVLGRLAGQDDVAVGSPVANRGRSEIEGLIGFFVNLLALRTDLSGDPAFAELLGRVRRMALDAYAHQELPFERIVDELRPERDLSRQPLVQVMIALQDETAGLIDLPGITATPLADPARTVSAKFDLTLSLERQGSGLAGLLEYSADLFDRTTVQRLAGHLLRVLEQVAARPDAHLSGLSLLTPAERHQAAREWNDTAAPFPAAALIHQLFEARADRRPGALAALWRGERITYGALEERANRLAHLLRDLGVEPGVSVGIWMERSLDMIVAVLGVLKAGGIYLPCDAAWPADRVEAILAGTGTVLTRAALLPAVEEMQQRLPALDHAVCLDVQDPEPPPEPLDPEAVRALFDHVAERAVDRVTAGGFVSAATGLPFSEAEVDEYRDRVLALAGPWLRPGARVLEIGCGSGLLLWEMVARGCRCTGLDPSPLTQERNREHVLRHGLEVELITGFAHEIGEIGVTGAVEGGFDLVLLASTVQFFPGRRYLHRVLEETLAKLAPGGAVLVADVPDARHECGKVLSLDEEWFRGLPAQAEVHRRGDGFANELRLRYDVVLRKDLSSVPARRKRVWTSWHVERCPASRLPTVIEPESLAYVIHTSGSTGRPKGIAVQHRPVINLIHWLNPAFGVGEDDRVLFVTSLAFDLSVWDLFGLLAAGGSIHVASEDDLRDPGELVRVLRREPVTVWDSAPAALAQLAPLFPAVAAESRLRLVLLSGDWIPVTLPDRVRSAFPGARVISLGGATEATVWSNWYPVGEVDPRRPSIPYGRPIANARYHVIDHVLDAAFEPCPIGVPGDLYIGGDCLSVGYAGQPELTAAAFLPDPFSAGPGARLYRTGDRARAFADGNLEILGRVDQQVKVRGFRIELGEIEAALARHPAVREAAVIVREDIPGDKRLVAYVVTEASLPADLHAWLRQSLPDYMVPAAFVRLAALPVTANGKLDRRALPAPRWEGFDEITAAATPTEERLLAVWREVLGVERLGVHDSFFDLGGHSLLATQLMARLRERFGAEVPLRMLFQSPTVAGLAAVLDGLNDRPTEPLADSIPVIPRDPRDPRDGDLPLSASQLRQWFLSRLDPGDPAYTLPLALDLEGDLQPAKLERALAEIVRRHEVLRTTFPDRGGRPVAVVAPPGSTLAVPRADLSALPAARRAEETRRLAEAEADRPFDLARGPLLRLALLRLAREEHRLLVTVHHIVFDGWSQGVFNRELAALYEGAISPELPELPVQYADYAAWQREWLAGPAAAAQVEHWCSRLGRVPRTLSLPTDRARPAVQSSRGALLPLDLPPGLGRELRAFAAREGATLFMTVLAAWSALLARQAGQDAFNVGTFVANRRREVLERLLGLFVNTLVLPMDVDGDPSWRGLLARVRESTLDAFEHQELPFERLLEALELERDLSRTPLFQVLFGVQSFAQPSRELPGLTLRPLATAEHDRVPGDLALWVWEDDGEEGAGVAGWLKFATDLYDRTTAIRLGGHLVNLLAAALADPAARLSGLPLLADAERHQLLHEWGRGKAARDAEDLLPVHERIAAQAARTPHALAVEMGDEWLSYAELDLRAAGLARELRRRGAGPESVVGVAAERSPAQIVALLGILRAGAAYLPLDPALPPARLARLVAESGARLAVASRAGAAGLRDVPVETVVLDRLSVEPDAPEAVCPVDSRNLAYVLFTSGSTGAPKGVMIEHGSLSRFVTTCLDLYGFAPSDRVLQFAPLSFDISVEEIFTCLTAGATLVLRDEEMIATPSFFLARCQDLGITVLDLPTAYAHELAPALAALPPMTPVPRSLRLLIIAGERALPGPVGEWLAAAAASGDRVRVLDTYGPTETTVVASASELRAGPASAPELTIGRPIRGVEIRILDSSLRPVPAGVSAEVFLGGAGLGRGYLNRPDLTAERFVPSPFADGARLYRTGDLARWLPDGRIEFAGRVDDQVKIRGFRIEPGEIAAVLSGHPGVGEAVVVARSTPSGTRLAAYVVPAGHLRPDSSGLRAWLKERLPAYMVPADVVLLDSLPTTPGGKVDRRALPESEGPARERRLVAPVSLTEELMAGIWSQLLGVDEVGLYDDFFDLGGHSLLAPQLLARIQETFQVDLPLRVLFAASTVAQLSAVLEEKLLEQIEELTEEEAASLLGAG
jgi:amino acid adenylation domain-containing protein